MAVTHRDIVTDALISVGLIQFGDTGSGRVYLKALATLQNMLQELHEYSPLDFDPADDDAVPEERSIALTNLLLQTPPFRQFNPEYDVTGVLFDRMRGRLYGNINPSDFIEPVVEDF